MTTASDYLRLADQTARPRERGEPFDRHRAAISAPSEAYHGVTIRLSNFFLPNDAFEVSFLRTW